MTLHQMILKNPHCCTTRILKTHFIVFKCGPKSVVDLHCFQTLVLAKLAALKLTLYKRLCTPKSAGGHAYLPRSSVKHPMTL